MPDECEPWHAASVPAEAVSSSWVLYSCFTFVHLRGKRCPVQVTWCQRLPGAGFGARQELVLGPSRSPGTASTAGSVPAPFPLHSRRAHRRAGAAAPGEAVPWLSDLRCTTATARSPSLNKL